MRLYVGNLSFNTGESEIEQLFATIGPVDSVRLIRDSATGQSRGFAFVEMVEADHGQTAVSTFDQHEFEGRRLTVNEARPQEPRNGGGGNRGGGRQPREARW